MSEDMKEVGLKISAEAAQIVDDIHKMFPKMYNKSFIVEQCIKLGKQSFIDKTKKFLDDKKE